MKTIETITIINGSLFGKDSITFNTQADYENHINAMIDYVEKGGESRGSALYSDEKGEVKPRNLDHRFIYSLEKEEKRPQIQEVKYEKGNVVFSYRDARPIPEDDDFFENVWSQ